MAAITALYTGCNEDNNNAATTKRTTQFDGAQGNCTNGGVKAARVSQIAGARRRIA